jgi:CBS domain-containing protein
MNVIDVMTAKPVTIRANRTLQDALKLMEQAHCKHLPVISTQGHLIGVLSDRDCRYALNSPYTLLSEDDEYDNIGKNASQQRKDNEAALAQALSERAKHLKVREIMTTAPIVIEPDAPASDAARLMLTHRIGCLPVMRAETLVGIVTRSDMLVAFMNIHRRYEIITGQVEPTANFTNVGLHSAGGD